MKRAPPFVAVSFAFVWAAALVGCEQRSDEPRSAAASAPVHGGAAYDVDPAHRVSAAELAAIGRDMFFDPSLSASGRVSCASCHDPSHGHAPANALPVQLGGADGRTPGLRNAPTLRYLQTLPPFSEHHRENEGDDSVDAGPTGGHTWDGRAGSAHQQASLPLLSTFEMANASTAAFVQRLSRAIYAPRFRASWGDDIFGRPDAALQAATMALEVYEQTPAEFQPFTSKYDAVLRGQATLTAAESRGLAAFDDPARGNCASCHPTALSADGAFPLFTDFGLAALGVPRNRAIPANADAAYFDLGLCARCVPTCATAPTSAAAFARRRCATSRRGRASSTTAWCTIWPRPCASTPRATRTRRTGMAALRTAHRVSSTICPRVIAATSSAGRRSAAFADRSRR